MELQECNLHRGTDSANASLIKTSLYALLSRALRAKAKRFEIREVEMLQLSRECASAVRTLADLEKLSRRRKERPQRVVIED
jgi:hypothetical protein